MKIKLTLIGLMSLLLTHTAYAQKKRKKKEIELVNMQRQAVKFFENFPSCSGSYLSGYGKEDINFEIYKYDTLSGVFYLTHHDRRGSTGPVEYTGKASQNYLFKFYRNFKDPIIISSQDFQYDSESVLVMGTYDDDWFEMTVRCRQHETKTLNDNNEYTFENANFKVKDSNYTPKLIESHNQTNKTQQELDTELHEIAFSAKLDEEIKLKKIEQLIGEGAFITKEVLFAPLEEDLMSHKVLKILYLNGGFEPKVFHDISPTWLYRILSTTPPRTWREDDRKECIHIASFLADKIPFNEWKSYSFAELLAPKELYGYNRHKTANVLLPFLKEEFKQVALDRTLKILSGGNGRFPYGVYYDHQYRDAVDRFYMRLNMIKLLVYDHNTTVKQKHFKELLRGFLHIVNTHGGKEDSEYSTMKAHNDNSYFFSVAKTILEKLDPVSIIDDEIISLLESYKNSEDMSSVFPKLIALMEQYGHSNPLNRISQAEEKNKQNALKEQLLTAIKNKDERRIKFYLNKGVLGNEEILIAAIQYGINSLAMELVDQGFSFDEKKVAKSAISNGMTNLVTRLINNKRLSGNHPDLLVLSAKKEDTILVKEFYRTGTDVKESVMLSIEKHRDNHITELVANLGDEEGWKLLTEYREKEKEKEMEKKRLAEIRSEKMRKEDEARKEREKKLYFTRKKLGDRVCKQMRVWFSNHTVVAFVEGVRDDRIKLRISDTEGVSINYKDVNIYRGVIIWDEYYEWKPCR